MLGYTKEAVRRMLSRVTRRRAKKRRRQARSRQARFELLEDRVMLDALPWLDPETLIYEENTTSELSYTIVDTGQTTCYDNATAISAPAEGEAFYGQDAQVDGNQPSYSLSSDGLSVLDNVTGLTWTQSPDLDGDGDIDVDDKLTFAEAMTFADTTLNTQSFGGYSDWRLPSMKELYSLMDFRGTDPIVTSTDTSQLTPFIDTDYFDFGYGDIANGERIIDAQFWSSNAYVGTVFGNQSAAFGLNLADGRIKGYPTGTSGPMAKLNYVFFVRGDTDYGVNDFVDNDDGTITDNATGLMWSQDDSGEGMNWEDALAWVQQKNDENYLGHSDWRLPNAKELQSIVDYSRSPDTTGSAAIAPVFDCTAITNEAGQSDYGFYWTGTTHVRAGGHAEAAAYVAFGRGLGSMDGVTVIDVHGAGCQRSDPKDGDPNDYPSWGNGPQGDVQRVFNFVRLVRDTEVSGNDNVAPTAEAAGPYTGDVDETITLSGSGSTDSDGTIALYEWDLDNDGQYDDATGVSAQFSSSSAGVYTVGLRVTDDDGATDTDTATVNVGQVSEVFDGYTLLAPLGSQDTYLIDNDGTIAHSWSSDYAPALSAYLLEDGTLMRTASLAGPGQSFAGGGAGGRVEQWSWSGELLWEYEYSGTEYCLHHDIEVLPNGNVLMIAWEVVGQADAIAAGRDPSFLADGSLWPDHVIEVEPTGSSGGNIVWEWHAWDHLVQDHDASKDNYAVVAEHPELIDVNYVSGQAGADWTHINSIDYNAELDQILLSVHNFSEIWIIDHSTTTAEAAGHSGGDSGSGGDLLYRWGNPQTYDAGTAADQELFGQHDAEWIDDGIPGEDNILVFNNGDRRASRPYSSVDEIDAPLTVDGSYTLVAGQAYGPDESVWSYTADPATDFFADHISGAQRLANGNTLITDGTGGIVFEVTTAGATVWEYDVGGEIFRADRYAPSYAGFDGTTLDDEPENEAPVADPGGPYTARVGTTITLDASGSSDSDGLISLYEWDLDNDGQFDDATGVTASFAGSVAGVFTVGLQVTDDDGATGVDTTTITIEQTTGTSTVGVHRDDRWFLDSNGDCVWSTGDEFFRFGIAGDEPIVGDWNGDGIDDIGVHRGNYWYLDTDGNHAWNSGDDFFRFGIAGDEPIVGDWNGDGIDDIGVHRDNCWYLDSDGSHSWNAGDKLFRFGIAGDEPIAGDWDGDGVDEIGIHRGNAWYLDSDGSYSWNAGDAFFRFGVSGDEAIVGDWDGNGADEIGVHRGDTWYLDSDGNHSWNSGDEFFHFGASGDDPLVGNWASDGSDQSAGGAATKSTTVTAVSNDTAVLDVSYAIVDTGQTTCYDNSSAISDPAEGEAFFGQDAQFAGNAPSYIASVDGLTVYDNVTGLTWTQSPDWTGDGHIDSGDKFVYSDFLTYIDTLNAQNYGGYSDWRAPTIKELYSLIDFRGTDPIVESINSTGLTPFIDTDYFDFGYGDVAAGERIIDAQFWSSTEYVSTTMGGVATTFGVNFADGRIKGYGRNGPMGEEMDQYALFVRGNSDYGVNDFADNGDATITDNATGLMWSQDDSGVGMNWADALAWVQQKNDENYLGYSDWRLPNAKELQSIVDYSRSPDTTGSAAIDPLFQCTAITNEAGQTDYGFYWTGTTHLRVGDNAGAAAYVSFGRGLGSLDGVSVIDVHGAGCQRSDPKDGDASDYPSWGNGPQGDVRRVFNFVRLVRDADPTEQGTVLIAESDGSTDVVEGGAGDSYTIVLGSAPTGDVTISLTNDSQLSISQDTLTFTPEDWSIPQTISVQAIDDVFAEGTHSGVITHTATSTDPAYDAIAIDNVLASITDNDVTTVTADDFDRSDSTDLGPNWTEQTGDLAIAAGQLSIISNQIGLGTLNGFTEADVAVEAEVTVPTEGFGHIGLVARYSGSNDANMYLGALVGSGGKYSAQIWRNVNGAWTPLAAGGASTNRGTLRFEVVGQSLRLLLDGQVLAQTSDSQIANAGLVGLRGTSSTTADDFLTEPVEPSEPTELPFADGFSQTDGSSLSDAWVQQLGGFAVQADTLTASSGLNLATLQGVSETDVAVEADVTLATTGVSHAGLVARCSGSGDNNMYLGALVGAAGSYSAQIWRNLDGAWTRLAVAPANTGSGTLRFEVAGSKMTLLLDGTTVVNALDTAITGAGSVGLRAMAGTGYDNFSAEVISPSTTDSWSVVSGDFTVADQQLTATAPAINLAMLDSAAATDVVVEAQLSVASIGVSHAGLVARYTGAGDSNMYLAALVGINGSYTTQIWRNVGGSWALLAVNPVAKGSGTVRFEVTGSSLSLFLDGDLVTSAIDNLITGPGQSGVRGTLGTVFGSFSVE